MFIYNSTPHCVTGFAPDTLYVWEIAICTLGLLSNTNNDWGEDFVKQQARFMKSARISWLKIELLVGQLQTKCDMTSMQRLTPCPWEAVLVKQCAFKGRHKLQDQFGEERYVVVRCNAEQDLYEVRPALGGHRKWLNRKMLIIDPRRELTTIGEPLQNVLCDGNLQSDVHDSSSEDSDEESLHVVAIPQDFRNSKA